MIHLDEESLICDLAETYQIYDYKQLPLMTVAVFCCGLREDSRIKMKLSHQKVSLNTLLMAGISDRLGLLLWSKTKDGQKGTNKPQSILESLLTSSNKPNKDLSFDSSEDFEKTRDKLLRQITSRGED